MSHAPQFLNLWPTQLMSIALPGAEQANQVLAEWIELKDATADQMTTDYLDQNLFSEQHPAIQWLHQSCQRATLDYATQLGIDYPLEFTIQAWPNINRLGDYHGLHNHPHAWLSGTYYIQVPDMEMVPAGRADRTPNCISFFDPRPQANMNAIRGDGQIDPEHRISPTPGTLLLWPAFLHHCVHPNLAHEPRISVSFNVVLRWQDRYMPQASDS